MASIMKTPFGSSEINDQITLYTLTNSNNRLSVKIIDYGATIVQINYADRKQIQRDLVLGFDDLDGYKSSLNRYFGSTIGRVANRIENGTFKLNNQQYNLYKNNGQNSLHGGLVGFDKRKWKLIAEDQSSIKLQYTSYDGEEGYPGTLETIVEFKVDENDSLTINYQAKLRNNEPENKQTIVSLTNHSYFNLDGAGDPGSISILDHKIRLYSNRFLECNPETLIPTGKILPVKGTPFELNQSKDQPARTIGEEKFPYDNCMVLDTELELENRSNFQHETKQANPRLAAEVYSPKSGIRMKMLTTEPSFQFYIGGHIPVGLKPKLIQRTKRERVTLGPNSGFCLEAQRFTNAINVSEWRRQVILEPDGIYNQTTVYQFDILKSDDEF